MLSSESARLGTFPGVLCDLSLFPQRYCILAADENEKTNGAKGLTSVIANAGIGMPVCATNLMGTLYTVTPIVQVSVERATVRL